MPNYQIPEEDKKESKTFDEYLRNCLLKDWNFKDKFKDNMESS